MAGFFDENMKKMESGTRKMTARRMTKRLEGTILNRHKNVVCIVQGGQQTIQSKIMNYV